MKVLERRYNDVAKRVQRKSQVLSGTLKGVEAAQGEINEARQWVREKMTSVTTPPLLGFDSKTADERQNQLNVSYAE